MSDSTELIIFSIILAIAIGFTYITVTFHKEDIRKALEKKGAKNITISWEPFDFDKSNHTYSISYDDATGTKHNTSCKVHIWGSSIYWENEDK